MIELRSLFFAAPLMLVAGASLLSADTVTDTSLNVHYTATSTFTAAANNTYDVFLNVDATGFDAGNGFLTALGMQFKTGNDTPSSVSLVEAPGGVSAWGTEKPGGLAAHGCDTSNPSSGFVCFQNLRANTTVPASGDYTFEFAVTMPGSDKLSATSEVEGVYNTELNNSGKNLGLSSMGISIQPAPAAPTVPEPSSLLLLGSGLIAIPALGRLRRARAGASRVS